ncbi:MAG: hypothetical protein HYY80_00480 [Chloroflexi bacterium]|nr:hypothetical protein [Chloroflexota bacterium]MBI3931222.1 hypothetical protein [Chloroflexota bacterium]
MNRLEVYVARYCFGYKEAVRLAGEIEQSLPSLQVNMTVIDEVDEGNLPDIPATPSYFLDGRLLFLGNPRLAELVAKIASFSQDKGENHG